MNELKPNFVQGPTPGQLYRPYTALLLAYGALSLAWAAVLQTVIPRGDPVLLLGADLHLLLGGVALFVVVLRRTGGVAALPASTALILGLAIDFPVGSALAVYWLVQVRRIERQPPSREKTVDLYTTGLYIAGLGFALAMVAFQSLLVGVSAIDLFGVLAAIYGVLSGVLLAVATLRCLSRSWGYAATFGLNVLLAPLVPFGTAASLVWFLGVRKREREIVADPNGLAIAAEFE